MREYGTAGSGDPVIAIHGMMAKRNVIEEWYPVAEALAQRGMHVIVPNLHSNRATKPARLSEEAFDKVATALIEGVLTSPGGAVRRGRVVLMGKSWGGKQVLEYAGMHPGVYVVCLLCVCVCVCVCLCVCVLGLWGRAW